MKKWIAIILVLVLVCSLAGCGVLVGRQTNVPMPNKWGITLELQDITPVSLTMVCTQSGGEGIVELQTGRPYVIQKWKNGEWVDLDYIPPEYNIAWPMDAWPVEEGSTNTWEVNWEWLYGELRPGEYRIAREFDNIKAPGDYETETIYAEFVLEKG